MLLSDHSNASALYDYMLSISLREPPVFAELREYAINNNLPQMYVSAEQGQLIAFLVKTANACRILELGTYIGYSTLWLAAALPKDGKVTACDIDSRWQEIANLYWRKAGLENKIALTIKPAISLLDELLQNDAVFDVIFIDADKQNYPLYYEKSLQLLKSGGLIIIDNIFLSGRVLQPNSASKSAEVMREFNKELYVDERIDLSIIPIRDGMTLARKL